MYYSLRSFYVSATMYVSSSVRFCKRQSDGMEKYCPQQGLTEHWDIVFVAEALSQVSK